MSTISEISSLLETLTTSIEVFKAELTRQDFQEPSLLTSKPHPIDDTTYVAPPMMYEARRLAVSSLERLKLLLESPSEALGAAANSSGEYQGLRLAAELDLHGFLESVDNPEEGQDVRVLADQTNTEPLKLESVLRLLVHRGWFRETKHGYFANNRRSHTLKKGSGGYHAAKDMNYYMYNVIGKLPEAMTHLDESFRMSRSPDKTGWNLYANTDLPFFGEHSWLEMQPGEAERFALGMGGMGISSDNGVAFDVPWAELAKDKDAIVDVGGGQGTLCCSLAAVHPEIKQFIVQDLPAVKEAAEKYIASKGLSHRVRFEAQNFFEPNRRNGTGRYVFVMQKVLHDWSDEEGARMLSQIRDSLVDGKSQMLIIDPIISPGLVSADGQSAKDSLSALEGETRYKPVSPPPFIPQDFGPAMTIAHEVNICLISLCNSFERTYASMQNMVELAGMKIKEVTTTRGYVHVTEVEIA